MAKENETVTTDATVDAEAQEVEESVEEESTEEAEAQESEETTDSTESKESEENIDIDYKAIAEAERQKREKAEKAAADAAYKLREAKNRDGGKEETTEEVDLDKPMTMREAMAFMQDQQQEMSKSQQQEKVKAIIEANTSSPEEAEAALLMYQNRVVPTGDPEADAMFAIGGLNARRTKQIVEEVKRAGNSKQNASTTAPGSQQADKARPETKISSADAAAIKAAGMTWDGKQGLYKKPIAGGKKFMYYDPKRPVGEKKWVA